MARGLILALQFLTRLPVPPVRDFRADDLSASAIWFPVVGAIVGGIVCVLVAAGARIDPWVGALLGTVGWVLVTGGLHLDGLADLADALGASHRERSRLLEVLRDPHVGAFGVLALIVAVVSKLVLLRSACDRPIETWAALPLIAAWARFGALVWSAWLPPLAPGTAERFAWRTSKPMIVAYGVVLAAASLSFVPALIMAPLAIWGWGVYLRSRVGGVTGDCLGAGIEVTEILLLLLLGLATSSGFSFFSAPASV